MRYGAERNSADRIIGVFISVPFGGEARLARSEEAEAHTDAAAQREAALVRRLSAEVLSTVNAARVAAGAARQAAQAAGGMRRHADLSALGFELGEGSLSEVLLARRLALEAELAAVMARLEASELCYRLRLDAHQLWDFD